MPITMISREALTALAVFSGVAAATAVASRKVGVAGRNVRMRYSGEDKPGVAELSINS